MNHLLILGAGTAGTMMANKLHKHLSHAGWEITIIEKETSHYYQPGFLFIPFGYYEKKNIVKPVRELITNGVKLLNKEVERIITEENKVVFTDGNSLNYDILVIATGARIVPDDTPGMKGELWQKKVFDFYTIEGAEALREFFKTWKGGNLVINIADNPIKCPVAPLEFSFFADDYFTSSWAKRNEALDD